MDGVRVLELAGWTFVPAAGATLTDWGADVIKVEHPVTGDPQRGLSIGTIGAKGASGVSFIMEQPNRGKRSIGLDYSSEAGREALLKIAATCDVFLTNLLPGSLGRAHLTVEDLRAVNPTIIYARGTGYGVRGDEADKGGFDAAAYLARGGIAHMLKYPTDEWPAMPRPAFGDIVGGFAIASGIAAALYKRERTGEPSVVDVSLLGLAAWQLSPDIVAAGLMGDDALPRFTPDTMPNPLVNWYRTKDDRFVQLTFLQLEKLWPEVGRIFGRQDLVDDERWSTPGPRFENREELIRELRTTFASFTADEWRDKLADCKGVWAIAQTPGEVLVDPQVVANGYVRDVATADGEATYQLVANPTQFDETPYDLTRAPDHAVDTDDILKEAGYTDEELIQLKIDGVVT